MKFSQLLQRSFQISNQTFNSDRGKKSVFPVHELIEKAVWIRSILRLRTMIFHLILGIFKNNTQG